MRIDTHTHVPDLTGVDKIIFTAASNHGTYSVRSVFDTAQKDDRIFCAVGLHPDSAGESPDYEYLLENPKVVAVGEIGLDYHEGPDDRSAQIELFQKQIEIARRAGLPVAIHSRDAESDTMDILKDIYGVMHCFTGSYDFAKTMVDRGFYISASGIITFKNADSVRETFARLPIDRIIAETDSPFCAPVPHRGKPCAPSMIAETIAVLAGLKNMAPVEMEDILWNNAHKVFPKLNGTRNN